MRQLLRDQAPVFAERLAAVHGSAEWVVALFLLREHDAEYLTRSSPAIQNLLKEIESSSPGRAHLLRRRLGELQRDESRRLQRESAEAVLASLREVTEAVYPEPLPQDSVERPLVRASVLVRRLAEARFLDAVERLQAQWPEPMYRLQLTGPWPPYRFGGLRP